MDLQAKDIDSYSLITNVTNTSLLLVEVDGRVCECRTVE